MFGLSEKVSLICRDKINDVEKISLFTGIAKNVIQELFIVIHAQAFHLFIQATFQHGSFGSDVHASSSVLLAPL